jgi:tetratricopeptide (TPR) repeat protein
MNMGIARMKTVWTTCLVLLTLAAPVLAYETADEAYKDALTKYKAKKYEEARAAAKEAVTLTPSHVRAQYLIGDTFKRQGKYEEARAEYTKATGMEDGRLEDRLVAQIRIADTFMEERNFKKGMEAYTVVRDGDWGKYSKQAKHKGQFGIALALTRSREYKKAIAEYEKVLVLSPNDMYSHYQIGRCYLNLKDLVKAREVYEKVSAMEEKRPRWTTLAMIDLGEISAKEKKFDEARTWLTKVIETPKASKSYQKRAQQLMDRLSKKEEAEKE